MDDEGHKRMYRSSKPRSLVFTVIIILLIMTPLKVQAHASAEINNVLNENGYIVLHLYENKNSFKKFNPDRTYKKVAIKGTTIIPIDDYHEGEIAIFVFHDENNDEKFNTSIFWTPKEGYAYSNSYIPTGIPKYEEALFSLEHGVPVNLTLTY